MAVFTYILTPVSNNECSGVARRGGTVCSSYCYAEIDEYPTHDGDSTYVYGDSSDKYLGVNLSDPSSPVGVITNVEWVGVLRAESYGASGAPRLIAYLKIGSNRYTKPWTYLQHTDYQTYTYSWSTNPATGAAWTWSDINNLVAGAYLGHTVWLGELDYAYFVARLTQLYVRVTSVTANATQAIIL